MNGLLSQMARFGAVGVVSTGVHLLVAWSAFQFFGTSPLTSNAVGFCAAFGTSYLGHFYWTFGQRTGHPVRLPKFLAVSGAGFLLTHLITLVVTASGQTFNTALLLILMIVPAATWTLSRFWAFRD